MNTANIVNDIDKRDGLQASQNTNLANVNFSRREDDVYLDVSDGLEPTEVPRVLITAIVRRYIPI